jgi:hypothetical protein
VRLIAFSIYPAQIAAAEKAVGIDLIIIKHVAPTTAGNTAESARGITKDPGTAMGSQGAFFLRIPNANELANQMQLFEGFFSGVPTWAMLLYASTPSQ